MECAGKWDCEACQKKQPKSNNFNSKLINCCTFHYEFFYLHICGTVEKILNKNLQRSLYKIIYTNSIHSVHFGFHLRILKNLVNLQGSSWKTAKLLWIIESVFSSFVFFEQVSTVDLSNCEHFFLSNCKHAQFQLIIFHWNS